MTNKSYRMPEEAPYGSPDFEEIEIPSTPSLNRPIPNKAGKSIIGLHIEQTREGQPLCIFLSSTPNPVLFPENILDLAGPETNGLVYVTLDSSELDLLAKCFGPTICEELIKFGKAFAPDCQIWYTPRLSLTIRSKRSRSTIRIYALSNWAKGGYISTLLQLASIPPPISLEDQAEVAEKLAWKILRVIRPYIPGGNLDLSSPSSVISHLLYSDLAAVHLEEIPLEAQQLAYECLHTPWIEMFQMGHFPSSYDYDINSAYPREISSLSLIDKTGGDWKLVHEFVPSAKYGFYRAIIKLRSTFASPIRFRPSSAASKLFSPHGTWIGYITQAEINFVHHYRLGTISPLYGWIFTAKPELQLFPFQRTFNRMLELRASLKQSPVLDDRFASALIKVIIARACGKFLQRIELPTLDLSHSKWVAGRAFCPVYACEVMTQTKLHLARLLLFNPGTAVSVTVDGALLSKPLKQAQTGNELKVEAAGVPSTILAPLISQTAGRSFQYDLQSAIEDNPNSTSVTFSSERRMTLCEAITRHSFDNACRVVQSEIRIPLWHDTKRYYRDGLPLHNKDLLSSSFKSYPLHIDEIMLRTGVHK